HTFFPRTPLVTVRATLHTAFGTEESTASSQVVPEGPCRGMTIDLKTAVNGPLLTVKRSAVARVRSQALLDCDEDSVSSIEWVAVPSVKPNRTETMKFREELQELAGEDTLVDHTLLHDRHTAVSSSLDLGNSSTSDVSLGIPPHTLDFGLYDVAVYYNVTRY
ncbi:hypothetical protein FHG87_017532, partial [Trinorchestia longiramus]